MKTAIIVVNYRTPWHLNLCLESVFKHTQDFHLFVVQNSPDPKSIVVVAEFKAKYPDNITEIVNEQNAGYVGGVNSAYAQAMEYERICLLNSDIIVSEKWLSNMSKVLDENDDVVQVYPDTNSHYDEGFIWKLVRKLPIFADELYSFQVGMNPPKSGKSGFEETKEFYLSVGGYCNLFRTKFFKDLGYFLDPGIIHGYWDDFDLAYYLRQFGKVGTSHDSYVFHFLNTSFKKLNINPQAKTLLAFYNGLYIMHKWSQRISEELKSMNAVEFAKRVEFSHVLEMYAKYLGTIGKYPQIVEDVQGEAGRIGREFLK